MTVHPLERIFFPRRIAIAGLSPRPGTWGLLALEYLTKGGFEGEVLAYRPRHRPDTVPTIESFDDGAAVDLLLVTLPAEAAVQVVAQAAAAGVGGAVVFSSGFAEESSEGKRLQEELVRAAGEMPVFGPNCLGLVSAPGGVVASVSGFLGRPFASGPVALVSQSGAMGFVLADQLQSRGVGFTFYASTGNEAVLQAPEVIEYVSSRPEVKVVGAYVEGVRDVAAWRRACQAAAANGCQVVVLKVGTTAAAQRAALSHTAAAAGEADLFEAVCREDGVVVVPDEVSFADAISSLGHPVQLPARPGVGVLTMSGGGGAMIADQLRLVADVPPLHPQTTAALHQLGIALAGDANPIDLTGMFFRHLDRLEEVISILASDPAIDAIALYFTFGDAFAAAYRELAGRLHQFEVPTWFVWAGAPEGEVEALGSTGRVVSNIPAFVRSIGAQRRGLPEPVLAAMSAREQALTLARASGERLSLPNCEVHTELVLAGRLASAGLGYAPMVSGSSADQLVEAVIERGLRGPWVVKVDHALAPHRARLGLLQVGVGSLDELATVATELLLRADEQGCTGAMLVVESMVASVGEFSLGALRHPDFGPVALIGPGGGRVEEAGAERAAACLPLSPAGLEALWTRVSALTAGAVEVETLTTAVAALEAVLEASPLLAEVDINPVLVTPGGALSAVDCLGIAGEES